VHALLRRIVGDGLRAAETINEIRPLFKDAPMRTNPLI
jgi:hypothetical protein